MMVVWADGAAGAGCASVLDLRFGVGLFLACSIDGRAGAIIENFVTSRFSFLVDFEDLGFADFPDLQRLACQLAGLASLTASLFACSSDGEAG